MLWRPYAAHLTSSAPDSHLQCLVFPQHQLCTQESSAAYEMTNYNPHCFIGAPNILLGRELVHRKVGALTFSASRRTRLTLDPNLSVSDSGLKTLP